EIPPNEGESHNWSAALKVRSFDYGASKMAGNFDFRAIESMIVFAVSAIPVATDYIEAPRGEACRRRVNTDPRVTGES
ncbi:hypothetical protein, partial [Dietzia sp. 111N12-1]|uniref:hypothetical protein n=1 Tax=Dietzia sp. 111N12-1 TaxID=1785156 RepID=UPI001C12B210